MIFFWSAIAMAFCQVTVSSVQLSSHLGRKIMSQARRIENNYYDAEENNQWIANYSIKFQGCHTQLQFNANGNDNGDAMIINKKLARFRLCPSDACNSDNADGCSSGAEYVVDLITFTEAFTEAKMEAQQYYCEKYRETSCDCDQADDADACQYQCFANAGMQYCQQDKDDEEEFEVQRYLECQEIYKGGNGDDNQDDVQYYVGPYCSSDGSKILLGVFTDDTCSVSVSTSAYEKYNNGASLPYSSSSIVGLDCLSCAEANDGGDNADATDSDQVKEMCGNLYQAAGKCEQNFQYASNNDACNFIAGIQIKRSSGSASVSASPSKAAGAFIGIFAVSTVLLGAYVYYLQSKLNRAKVVLH